MTSTRSMVRSACCDQNPKNGRFCRTCGYLIVRQGFLENPDNNNRYEVIGPLAQGGMSTTYLVYNCQTDRLAVLKEIDADLSRKAKARELFLREANTLAALNHPGIPKFYDYFTTDNSYYLVMEMVHGSTLEHALPASIAQAVGWMIETCEVLSYMHGHNPPIIHRDIKPANLIFRFNPSKITLIDFGAVKEASNRQGTRIATPGYGAPEQSQGRPCLQSDIFGVATTLMYLLTRQYPGKYYEPRERRFILDSFDFLPRPLIRVLSAASAFDPLARPKDTQAMIAALRPFA
ncbi:MAG: serine/threonine protein kinase [Anaerolineae bacterium]|nr:serine/threonine protein kinase [Gloeobacterales cyanobacterium ES-bin-313]